MILKDLYHFNSDPNSSGKEKQVRTVCVCVCVCVSVCVCGIVHTYMCTYL